MSLFLYYEQDSFLHRVNPLAKIGVAVLLIASVTIYIDPVLPISVIGLIALTLVTLGRIPVKRLVISLWPFIFAGIGLFWTSAVFYQPTASEAVQVITQIGPFRVTEAGFWFSLSITLRLLAIFMSSMLFVLTTDPTVFVLALVQQVKLPYRLGYGILAGYRFVPLLSSEFDTIRAAHKVRGVREGGGVRQQFQRFKGYAIPLLASGIRKAERVALAMDARGFGAYPDRTYYRPITFERRDLIFVVGAIAVLLVLWGGLLQLGLLGQANPFATPRLAL